MAKSFRLSYRHKLRPNEFTRPPKPQWLLNHERDNRRSTEYWTKIYWATPPWLNEAQLELMKQIYLKADSTKGDHVDHIVPLKSPIVCGLHVPWNFQIINEQQNYAKSNHTWPGHPCENLDLFGEYEPQQMELPL